MKIECLKSIHEVLKVKQSAYLLTYFFHCCTGLWAAFFFFFKLQERSIFNVVILIAILVAGAKCSYMAELQSGDGVCERTIT